MEENKNTYFYKKNIVINKERVAIVPEVGDEFILCKDLAEVYRAVSNNKFAVDHPDKVIEDYSSENLGEDVKDYNLCHPLSINGSTYKFFGYKVETPNGLTKRKFYLYETQ